MNINSLYSMSNPPFILQLLPAFLFFFPFIANAQSTILDIIDVFQQIISALIPFTVALALFAVLFGLAKYAFRAGDEKAQSEGRNIMFWGIITLFVMVSIWGFVGILQNLFFGPGYTPTAPSASELPQLPTPTAPPAGPAPHPVPPPGPTPGPTPYPN
ncbi:MAG: hypothetical protein WDZ74_02325 [Candidatus Paceibacterota bacterium]